MSLEAINAVLADTEATDAGWRLLMLLALDANAEGLVAEASIPSYAKHMNRKAGGVAGVKAALIKSGLLVIVNEQKDGKRGIYRLALAGFAAAEEEPEPVSDELLPPTAQRPKGVKAETWLEFWRAGYPHLPQEVRLDGGPLPGGGVATNDPAQEVAADALILLGEKRKVGSKLVTPRELGVAAVCLLVFNREYEWKGTKGSDYGLGANLTEIVMRIRDRPNWDAATWVRLVESAWRIRWWEKRSDSRRPTPSVIWSPKAFEQVVQDAAAEKAAGQGTEQNSRRRFTREGRQ